MFALHSATRKSSLLFFLLFFFLTHSNAHGHHHHVPPAEKVPPLTVWVQAITATFLISAAPVFILLFIPINNGSQNRWLLNILLAFAMGGLLGDVFLHLLPHSFAPHEHHHEHSHEHHHDHGHVHHHEHNHDHDHEHHEHDHGHDEDHEHHHEHDHKHHQDHNHEHNHEHNHDHDHEHDHEHHEHSHEHNHHHDHDHEHHKHDSHEHSHGHSIGDILIGVWIIVGIFVFFIVEKFIRNITGSHGHSHTHEKKEPVPNKSKSKPKASPKTEKGAELRKRNQDTTQHEHKKTVVKVVEHEHISKVSGYLNLAADFTHNFTDGLAIGATFMAGERMGMITTLAILLHEVPHEIGDFAILVHSGFSKWQAMRLQFVTAIGAIVGTCVGLYAGELASASGIILPVTAGGFIYIATVSVIPELLEDSSDWFQTILELSAASIGVALMAVIAVLE